MYGYSKTPSSSKLLFYLSSDTHNWKRLCSCFMSWFGFCKTNCPSPSERLRRFCREQSFWRDV